MLAPWLILPPAATCWVEPDDSLDDQPAPAEVARGIAAAVRRMQDAARRADPDAYMLAIDTTDPLFAQEQRNRAHDLRTRPVASIEIRVTAGLARPDHADGTWRAPLLLRWTLPGSHTERTSGHIARFRPAGAIDGHWLYAGPSWQPVPCETARVLVAPDDERAMRLGERAAACIDAVRRSIEDELGIVLPAAPTVKIYADTPALQESIALGYTDPLAGWSEPGESIKLSAAEVSGAHLEATLAHELGHAVSYGFGDRILEAPWWALEGLAEVLADPFRPEPDAGERDGARELFRNDRLRAFEDLADFRGGATNHARHVYTQGRSMVRYITARFGRSARNDWFKAMGRGEDVDRATRDALGLAFERLDAAWRASLAP